MRDEPVSLFRLRLGACQHQRPHIQGPRQCTATALRGAIARGTAKRGRRHHRQRLTRVHRSDCEEPVTSHDTTPAEALEWALASAPGAGEALARVEVARLQAVEARFVECVELIGQLDQQHDRYCLAFDGIGRCCCDHGARVALRKLAGLE